MIKHGGGNPGYACIVVASIEHKTGYVIMTNAEDIGYFDVIAKLIGTEPLESLLGNRLHTKTGEAASTREKPPPRARSSAWPVDDEGRSIEAYRAPNSA